MEIIGLTFFDATSARSRLTVQMHKSNGTCNTSPTHEYGNSSSTVAIIVSEARYGWCVDPTFEISDALEVVKK